MKGQNLTSKNKSGEIMDSFITSHYKLAEPCDYDYDTLRDDFVRARLVAGIRHEQLSVKLKHDTIFTEKSYRPSTPLGRGKSKSKSIVNDIKICFKEDQSGKD